ncbi:MAG: hypothetical protein CMH48_11475 [Muricauda sp.]|nr:hypothetical protein [Allomuricauda sp.]
MMNRHNYSNYFLILATIALISCFSVKAQQDPTPELLYGTWVFNQTPSINTMDVAIQQDLQNSPELQQHVATFYTGRQLYFGQDGTFIISFSNGMQFNGQWSLQGSNLTTVTNGSPSATQTIVFSDNQNFYLVSPGYSDPDTKLLFSQLHFIKN